MPGDGTPLALADVRVVPFWADIMGFTPDGPPLIGQNAPGLALAADFNQGWRGRTRSRRGNHATLPTGIQGDDDYPMRTSPLMKPLDRVV